MQPAAIAGAIFLETVDPSYSWAGRARVLAGSFDTRQASVTLSAPLIRDQLAIGISGDVRLGEMASGLADGIPGADIRRDDYGIARIKAVVEPAGLADLRIGASYAHTRSQSPQFEAVQAPFRARRRRRSLAHRRRSPDPADHMRRFRFASSAVDWSCVPIVSACGFGESEAHARQVRSRSVRRCGIRGF